MTWTRCFASTVAGLGFAASLSRRIVAADGSRLPVSQLAMFGWATPDRPASTAGPAAPVTRIMRPGPADALHNLTE